MLAKAAEQKLKEFGERVLYLVGLLKLLFAPPYRWSLFLQQIEFVGAQSLGIIILTGFFTGAVFALQMGGIFAIFRAEGMVGGATGIALATELAPLMTAFLLTGRVGSSMTAEIATMVVNEQVSAIEAMGLDPDHYLVVPRVWASILMMPLLCGIFMLMGLVGAYIVAMTLFQVDEGVFFERLVIVVKPLDVISGLRKMFIFSFIIAITACHFGIVAKGGAKGVGEATTRSVVQTLLSLLFCDFIMSYIQLRWFT